MLCNINWSKTYYGLQNVVIMQRRGRSQEDKRQWTRVPFYCETTLSCSTNLQPATT